MKLYTYIFENIHFWICKKVNYPASYHRRCNFIRTYLKTYIFEFVAFEIMVCDFIFVRAHSFTCIWNHGVRLHLRSCARLHMYLKTYIFEFVKKLKKPTTPAFLVRGSYTTTTACCACVGGLHTTIYQWSNMCGCITHFTAADSLSYTRYCTAIEQTPGCVTGQSLLVLLPPAGDCVQCPLLIVLSL